MGDEEEALNCRNNGLDGDDNDEDEEEEEEDEEEALILL